jgi:hypothetical protein
MTKEKEEAALSGIKAKLATGVYDLVDGSIEARKLGVTFGGYLDGVIDSWGGVHPDVGFCQHLDALDSVLQEAL